MHAYIVYLYYFTIRLCIILPAASFKGKVSCLCVIVVCSVDNLGSKKIVTILHFYLEEWSQTIVRQESYAKAQYTAL